MSRDEWNKADTFNLKLLSPVNPFDQGFEGLEPVLEVIEKLGPELRPNKLSLNRELNYSRQALLKRFHETDRVGGIHGLMLTRSKPPELALTLTGVSRENDRGFSVLLQFLPLAFFREPGQGEKRAEQIITLVRSLASRLPLSLGLGHSAVDRTMGEDPYLKDRSPDRPIHDVFWLNIFGPRQVERVGRERMLSTPCTLVEELPGGAFLLLTRPTPADFDSEEARLAQARALVHLRPELDLDSTLATLRQRSLVFSPIPVHFDPDVAEILSFEVDFRGLKDKRQNVELFNRYHPPPVSEWMPASQVPPPDVPDVNRRIDTYDRIFAEKLIALFHPPVPTVMDGTVEALPRLDWHLWHNRWGKDVTQEQRLELISMLGAWLGRFLVNHLGGRWVPRHNIYESAVIIGDRAWLPFLRARKALNGLDAPLDFSCTQFFREAQRHARQQAH